MDELLNVTTDLAIYKENILDHYRHPRNKQLLAEHTLVHSAVNPSCGDNLTVQLLIEHDAVKAIGFTGTGCAISQAAMSMLTEELVGKNVVDVLALDQQYITELLGIPIGVVRMKCAMLGLRTTQAALKEMK